MSNALRVMFSATWMYFRNWFLISCGFFYFHGPFANFLTLCVIFLLRQFRQPFIIPYTFTMEFFEVIKIYFNYHTLKQTENNYSFSINVKHVLMYCIYTYICIVIHFTILTLSQMRQCLVYNTYISEILSVDDMAWQVKLIIT